MNAILSPLNTPSYWRSRATGITLVELLVGVAVGLFLLFGVVTVFTSTVRGSADNLRSARLNQELSAVMEMMVNDIRRAGYSNGDDNVYFDMGAAGGGATGVSREPHINVIDLDVNVPGAECILYSYDENTNGTLDATERHGFRLVNGVIQTRTSGANPVNCNNNADTWQPLTDGGTINVTTLAFSTAGSRCRNTTTGAIWQGSGPTASPCSVASVGDRTVETRQISITLAGEPVQDQTTTKRLVGSLKVQNDGHMRRCNDVGGATANKWYGSADCSSVP